MIEKDVIAYHYCSLEALFGIVDKKSFWLTSLNSSNDSLELKLGEDIVKKAILELEKEFPSKLGKKYKEPYFDKCIELLRKESNFSQKQNFSYYGFSLTSRYDNLTHWDRYGDNCEGVCIKINMSKFDQLFDMYAINHPVFQTWLQSRKILYNEREQVNYIKVYILEKLTELYKKEITNIEFWMKLFYQVLIKDGNISFKHSGFSGEEEERLYLIEGDVEEAIRIASDISNTNPEDKRLFNNLRVNIKELAEKLKILKKYKEFVTLKHGIRSKYDLKLSEIWSSDFIQEITIGPRSYQTLDELKDFLNHNGLRKTKVLVSKIPIR